MMCCASYCAHTVSPFTAAAQQPAGLRRHDELPAAVHADAAVRAEAVEQPGPHDAGARLEGPRRVVQPRVHDLAAAALKG